MRNICAEKADCRVIDLHKNAKPYGTLDGFHPMAERMKTIADAVVEECGKW